MRIRLTYMRVEFSTSGEFKLNLGFQGNPLIFDIFDFIAFHSKKF